MPTFFRGCVFFSAAHIAEIHHRRIFLFCVPPVVTMEFPYMSVERCELTASGAINSYRDRVVTNRDGTTVPISTVFGQLRDMLTRNGCSKFAPRTGESPICRPPSVTTRSPYMFVESLELTGSGVTNSSDGRVVTRADRTTVPISTVFGRFKDMPVSNVEADFMAHTDAYLRGRTHRGSSVPINNRSRSFGISPAVSSEGSFPVVNHAYLCLDVGTRSIRHQIINFCTSNANIPSNGAISLNLSTAVNIEVVEAYPSSRAEFLPAYMDLGDCHCECRHCGGLFWYNERLKGRQYSMHPEYHLCCGEGKFYMHPTLDPPVFIQQLLRNSRFMENICAYNQMFAMTSFGEKVNELDALGLNTGIVKGLIHVLDEHNGLVRLFRTARDRCNTGEIPGFKIKLYNLGGVRGYELPTSDFLGAIVFKDGLRSRTDFDVVIEFRELILKPRNGKGDGRKVTMNAYYKYQLHSRPKEFGLLFKSVRLFQQYVVIVLCAIEQSQLDFIRKCQKDLRSDYLLGLYDAISRGDRWGIMVGLIILLPSAFTGGLTPADRADIVCRVFQQKVKDFVKFLKEVKTFGCDAAVLYTIEFQKRGLPHCHTLLWVDSKNKITDASQIDEYISAELPDPVKDPKGYKLVSELMLHGPCGAANLSAPCTQNGTCNKSFPKRFNANMFFDSNGHTQYRRRDTGTHFMKHESRLDNCNVVPYNRVLCLSFEVHINVEYCGWSMLIKYLFKYISKGPNRILANISRSIGEPSTSASANNKKIDEIQNYVDGRFICPYKACWRIFDFLIHSQEPAVQILNVYLEDKQRVTFREREREVGHNYSKQWKRRQIATKKSLGRLTYVHPSSGELFYFRMLLCHQKECKSPIEVRTVKGEIFPTYRAAYEALDFLVKLWAKHWESMQDDIPMKISESTGILNYNCVRDFGLQPPPEHLLKDLENKLLMEEKKYNRELLMQDAILSVPKLNYEQKKIYDPIMNALTRNEQELLFVYGHGGTRKTFMRKTIISSLRSQGKIVLAIASSGIASLLLPAGRTAHLRFKFPLELTDESLCHVKKNTQLGKLLVETNLIIWDEDPMNDKRCFKTLDRTLKDLMSSPDLIFGGKTIILGEVFAKWLLDIGNGETGEPDNEDDQDSCRISIPPEYCVSSDDAGMSELIDFIYDETTFKTPTVEALQEKAIVCPKNDTANAVRAKILSLIEGQGKTYLSKDEAIPMGK
ncbi:DNA helicase [Tanacetum coccineum]|uniref:ATP-dependent DNA helicase n=1 Tax=Tanacetum coccineum TaxID=301880 RepID=A0ABQ4Z0T9_9ASTR